MGNKGKSLPARGKTQPGRKRVSEAGLYSKLAGIRKHKSVGQLDNRPDPFQKVSVFSPAERTAGFKLLSEGCWRRGGPGRV